MQITLIYYLQPRIRNIDASNLFPLSLSLSLFLLISISLILFARYNV